jgi:ADP-ribose pyrophosphatase YjhB (NUDIX family)
MEKQILKLFLEENNLKFSQIEKSLKVRSNKLNYHIKKLIKKGIIEKEKEFYKLTETSEHLIPYISEKNSALPVILILLNDGKTNQKAFLYKRDKRPYKDYLGLPGGRLLLGENISEATKRIMKEKHNINAKFQKVNSISLEHISKNKKTIHSFILIFVTATTKDKIKLTTINKNKQKIIQSDYNLIKNDFGKETNLNTIHSKTKL